MDCCGCDFLFSSRRRHTRCALVTGVQTCALPISIAVEVRDPEWLMPAFTSTLRAAGATYCLGLHAKMPPIDEQLPILRALWPGPLVCRWNLHRRHGAYGYEAAKPLYGDFNALVERKSGVEGKGVSVRVDIGGRRII